MAQAPHPVHPLPADLAREHRTEPVPPEAHGLMAKFDAALKQQVLDVPWRQRKADYIMTAGRIVSGDELKQRNGLGGLALDRRLIRTRYQPQPAATTLA